MKKRTKKRIAKRFIKFCERFMNLYVKNYELSLTAEIKFYDSFIAYYKTETTIYKFSYSWKWKRLHLVKIDLIEKYKLINGHKFYEYKTEWINRIYSNYIAGLKTWEEKYQEIINE